MRHQRDHAARGDVHLCADCGTKLYLSFERFPGMVGVYGGTFVEPDWLDIAPGNAKRIFLSEAHATTIEGVLNELTVFHELWAIGLTSRKT